MGTPMSEKKHYSSCVLVKGSMRTAARAPTALAKRWTVRKDGIPLPLSMRATTLWVVPMRAATSPCVRPAFVRAAISSRASY